MKFEVYQDKQNQWRWRLKAENGEILADSGEGYHNKIDALAAVSLIQREAQFAETKVK